MKNMYPIVTFLSILAALSFAFALGVERDLTAQRLTSLEGKNAVIERHELEMHKLRATVSKQYLDLAENEAHLKAERDILTPGVEGEVTPRLVLSFCGAQIALVEDTGGQTSTYVGEAFMSKAQEYSVSKPDDVAMMSLEDKDPRLMMACQILQGATTESNRRPSYGA